MNKSMNEIAFEKITEKHNLVEYLKAHAKRKSRNEYLHHYTSLQTVINIFRYQTWHLSQASCMNDQLEFRNGDTERWKNIFFSCFMGEDEESIGMWSMYGQPWERGVKISIPKLEFVEWLTKDSIEVREVNCRTKKCTDEVVETFGNKPFLTSIAYCNSNRRRDNNDPEILYCGSVSNRNLHGTAQNAELTGYIKDLAWSYEKEIRLRLEFNNQKAYKRVALKLPPKLLDSFILTPSPLFDGDFVHEIEKEIDRKVLYEKSIFKDKFQLKTDCKNCILVN